MAYDIPDKIQYKEKIVFNLTFWQLVYAVTFGLLAFFSYRLPLAGDAKFVPPAILCSIGLGLILFEWDTAFWNIHAYFTGIRKGGAMDPKVKQFIGLNKIENDTLYLNNGQMASVLTVVPINLQNMDEGRRESVKQNYREFLNQLSNPIQILVRTVNVELSEYFARHDSRVEKTDNQQLIALYNKFKIFEQGYVKENQVKERLYYVIIPYNPHDMLADRNKGTLQLIQERLDSLVNPKRKELAAARDEAHRRELADRTAIISTKLAQCTLINRRLSTKQLISLLMSYFDGYVEVDEDYLSRVVVSEKFIERQGGENDGKKETQTLTDAVSAPVKVYDPKRERRRAGSRGRWIRHHKRGRIGAPSD